MICPTFFRRLFVLVDRVRLFGIRTVRRMSHYGRVVVGRRLAVLIRLVLLRWWWKLRQLPPMPVGFSLGLRCIVVSLVLPGQALGELVVVQVPNPSSPWDVGKLPSCPPLKAVVVGRTIDHSHLVTLKHVNKDLGFQSGVLNHLELVLEF